MIKVRPWPNIKEKGPMAFYVLVSLKCQEIAAAGCWNAVLLKVDLIFVLFYEGADETNRHPGILLYRLHLSKELF